MNQELQRALNAIEDRLRALEDPQRQQLQQPVDNPSMGALGEAARGYNFPALCATGFFFDTANEADPSREGQLVYDKNAGGTARLRVKLGGTVRTVTVS